MLLERLVERAPVEQPGQLVVVGHVAQGRLLLAARGDVEELTDPAQRPAGVVAQEDQVGEHPAHRAVGADEALLGLVRAAAAVEDLPRGVDVGLAVLGMRVLLIAAPEQLLLAAAEQLGQRFVDAHVLAVGVEQRHPDRRVVEGGVEVALRLGDQRAVAQLAHRAQHLRLLVGVDPAHARLDRERHAVRAPALELHAPRRAALVLHLPERHRQRQQRRDRLARHRRLAVAEHLLREVVRGQHRAVLVEHQRGLGHQ